MKVGLYVLTVYWCLRLECHMTDKWWAELSGPLAESRWDFSALEFLSFAIKLFFGSEILLMSWGCLNLLCSQTGLHMTLLPWLPTAGVQLLTTTWFSYPRWIWRRVFPLTAIMKPAQRVLVLSWWNLVFWADCWGIPLLNGLPDELWKPSGTFGATIQDC